MQQATSALLDENFACELKLKNSFTLAEPCMKTVQFHLTVKSSLFLTVQFMNLPTKQRKNSLPF